MVAVCVNLITCSRGLMFLAELTDRLFAAGSRCLVGDIRPVKAGVRTARSGHFPALDTPGEGASEGGGRCRREGLERPGGAAAGAVSPAKEGGGRDRSPRCRGLLLTGGLLMEAPGDLRPGGGCLAPDACRLLVCGLFPRRWSVGGGVHVPGIRGRPVPAAAGRVPGTGCSCWPAWVHLRAGGGTRSPGAGATAGRVYPRVCGVSGWLESDASNGNGASPRMQGQPEGGGVATSWREDATPFARECLT